MDDVTKEYYSILFKETFLGPKTKFKVPKVDLGEIVLKKKFSVDVKIKEEPNERKSRKKVKYKQLF